MEYTVLAHGTDLLSRIEIRRSVFLTRLVRVEDEERARQVVAEQRRAHHDARHHVSAFVLGPDARLRRSSDDGEPAGTAGVPTLEALTSHTVEGRRDLSDVCAVTTRWFGGIKLGAGGLVRAYGQAVGTALSRARFARRIPTSTWSLRLDLARAGAQEAVLRAGGLDVLGTEYHCDDVTVRLQVPRAEEEGLARRVSALLSQDVDLVRGPSGWAERQVSPS